MPIRVRTPQITVDEKMGKVAIDHTPLPTELSPYHFPEVEEAYRVYVNGLQDGVPTEQAELPARLSIPLLPFTPPQTNQQSEPTFLMESPPQPTQQEQPAFPSMMSSTSVPRRNFFAPEAQNYPMQEPFLVDDEPPAPFGLKMPGFPKVLDHPISQPTRPSRVVIQDTQKTFGSQVSKSIPQASSSPAKATVSTVGKDVQFPYSELEQAPSPTGNKIVVSIPDKKIVVYDPTGKIIQESPVYIGSKEAPTPRGQFRIMNSIKPGAKDWFYGPRWMSFMHHNPKQPGNFGIHGWVYTKEDDIEAQSNPGWKTLTHGCVQMNNPDLAKMAGMVGVGDTVTIVDTPLNPPPPSRPQPKMQKQNLLQTLFGMGIPGK